MADAIFAPLRLLEDGGDLDFWQALGREGHEDPAPAPLAQQDPQDRHSNAEPRSNFALPSAFPHLHDQFGEGERLQPPPAECGNPGLAALEEGVRQDQDQRQQQQERQQPQVQHEDGDQGHPLFELFNERAYAPGAQSKQMEAQLRQVLEAPRLEAEWDVESQDLGGGSAPLAHTDSLGFMADSALSEVPSLEQAESSHAWDLPLLPPPPTPSSGHAEAWPTSSFAESCPGSVAEDISPSISPCGSQQHMPTGLALPPAALLRSTSTCSVAGAVSPRTPGPRVVSLGGRPRAPYSCSPRFPSACGSPAGAPRPPLSCQQSLPRLSLCSPHSPTGDLSAPLTPGGVGPPSPPVARCLSMASSARQCAPRFNGHTPGSSNACQPPLLQRCSSVASPLRSAPTASYTPCAERHAHHHVPHTMSLPLPSPEYVPGGQFAPQPGGSPPRMYNPSPWPAPASSPGYAPRTPRPMREQMPRPVCTCNCRARMGPAPAPSPPGAPASASSLAPHGWGREALPRHGTLPQQTMHTPSSAMPSQRQAFVPPEVSMQRQHHHEQPHVHQPQPTPYPPQPQQQPNVSGADGSLAMPHPTNEPSSTAPVDAPAKKPQAEDDENQRKKKRKPRVCPTTAPDGHQWLKYGEKRLLRSNRTRAYFRCLRAKDLGCEATKQLDFSNRELGAAVLHAVTYEGEHNHLEEAREGELEAAGEGEEQSVGAKGDMGSGQAPDAREGTVYCRVEPLSADRVSSPVLGQPKPEQGAAMASDMVDALGEGKDIPELARDAMSVDDHATVAGSFEEPQALEGPTAAEAVEEGTGESHEPATKRICLRGEDNAVSPVDDIGSTLTASNAAATALAVTPGFPATEGEALVCPSVGEGDAGIPGSNNDMRTRLPRRRFRLPGDGHSWVKYAEKLLARTGRTRTYFRCSLFMRTGCPARKLVDVVVGAPGEEDPQISYMHEHNHQCMGGPAALRSHRMKIVVARNLETCGGAASTEAAQQRPPACNQEAPGNLDNSQPASWDMGGDGMTTRGSYGRPESHCTA